VGCVCFLSEVVEACGGLSLGSMFLSRFSSQACRSFLTFPLSLHSSLPGHYYGSTLTAPISCVTSKPPLLIEGICDHLLARASCTLVVFSRPLHKSSSPFNIRASRMRTSSTGRSSAPTLTRPILCTIFIPLLTLPKIVCLPSSHGVGASVMKN
jgi:hypothetical protein